jgi:hypothetical protein
LTRIAKAIVAAVGVAATVAATIPPDTPAWRWGQVVIALATVLGVWATPNAEREVPSRAARRAQLADQISPPSSRIADERPPRRPPKA